MQITKFKLVFFLLLTIFSLNNIFAQQTNKLLLLKINYGNNIIKVLGVKELPCSKDYTSQPSFINNNEFLFISTTINKQTDVLKYNIALNTIDTLTHTPESEYSGKSTLNKNEFSAVRLPNQRLQIYDLNTGIEKYTAYEHKDSIGYYTWLTKNNIISFVLTKPHTLQTINLKTNEEKIIDQNIGRVITKYKKGFLYTKEVNDSTFKLMEYNNKIKEKMNMPEGSQDFDIIDQKFIVSSFKSNLAINNLDNPLSKWEYFYDLKNMGVQKINRIIINANKTYMVIKCN